MIYFDSLATLFFVIGVNADQEVHRVCEEERRSSKSFMRRVKILEEENG